MWMSRVRALQELHCSAGKEGLFTLLYVQGLSPAEMTLFCWGGRALCNAQNLPHTFCPAAVAEHTAPSGAKDVEPKVHSKSQEKDTSKEF